MATKQKETKPVETTAVVAAPVSSGVVVFDPAMMQADAGIGREQMEIKDMSLPYLTILQSLSPQVKKSSPTKIVDAEEGDIFNTVTQELISGEEGITIIPCAFQKAWVEWAPRDTGGGYINSYQDDAIMARTKPNELGFDIRTDNGNVVVPTFYYYCLELLEDGGTRFGIISMSRTQMKKGRKWNSIISSVMASSPKGPFNPPMFAQIYHLRTEPESNAKGDWYSWKIESRGLIDNEDLYFKAKLFSQQVRDGLIKVAPPVSDLALSEDDDAPM